MDIEINAKFKPRARLLIQLGDQLIKNESIALVELAKNSYDADANVCDIYMESIESLENGIIIIEDDGYGMTPEVVENVWLEPGSDFKTIKIKKLEGSPRYNRLPIGEKGIGRFGVHKLGNVIEMTTKAEGTNEVFVRIDWTEFDNYKYLEQVPIKIIERSVPLQFINGQTGTSIVIKKLRKQWERGIAREVKRSITSLASPFSKIDSFLPSFEILDKPGWFDGLLKWEEIKHYSLFNFKITIQGNGISSFAYDFTPWATMTKIFPRTVNMEDPFIQTFKNLRHKNDNKKEEFFSLSDFNVGSVTFEGYIFDLDGFILKMGVTDKKGFKDYMKNNGGIKVFRDGLRVYDYGEPENDWLGLDYRRFQQPTKAISNNLILGAIYLDRKSSSDLEEKTNREGFVDNLAYAAFKDSIIHCIDLVETLRLHDKKYLKERYGATAKSEPVMNILDETKKYVEEHVLDLPVRKQIVSYLIKIEADYKRVNENLLKAAGAGLSMSVVVHEVEKIIFELDKVVKMEMGSDRLVKLVQHLSSLIDGYSEIIRRSNQVNENLTEIIDQALFNTEFRLAAHKISLIAAYKNFSGKKILKLAKSLIIGTLMNLVDNSIYWLDQKGIKAIEDGKNFEKKLYINLFENENHVFLVIADNGTGFLIPTDDVTEPFVSARPGGIGLGLHIAKEIIEAQKGRLLFPDVGDFDLPEEFHAGAVISIEFKK